MKRRLFWKILFSFWLTFFAITQGVFLTLQTRQDRGSFLPGGGGPPQLALAAVVLEHSNADGFEAFRAELPPQMRDSLVLTRLTGTDESVPAPEGTASRIVTDPQGIRYLVTWSQDLPERRGILMNVPPHMLVFGILGGLLFSAALARYVTDPINRLRVGFEMLTAGKLDTRVAGQIGKRNDEIADLGRDFDRMAARLEDLVAERVRLLHDVSHEFRSPDRKSVV